MSKIQKVQLSENERKLLLEQELQELHQEERQVRNFSSGRKLPKYSNMEGFDRQEVYDKFGHC